MGAGTPPQFTLARPFSLAPLLFEGFASTMSLMAFVAIIGPISRMLQLEPWQVGVAITSAGVAWTLMARWWGAASDAHGRRRIMLIGLAGFVVSYALLCTFMAVALHEAWPALLVFIGLVIGRTLAGAFYAAVPVSSIALIADHAPSDQRARGIAGLSAANGLGMVMGPASAGALASFGMSAPLVFIALLPALSLLVLWRALPRDTPRSSPDRARLRLLDPRLRQPLTVALVAMLCVHVAQITVGFYALDRFALAPAAAARTAGIALAAVGIALIGAQMLMKKLAWAPARLIRWGAGVAALGFGSAAFAANEAMLWASYFVGAAGMGFVFPAFFALGANSVDENEQGAAAGAISSVQGLGAVLGPLLGTLIYEADMRAPYLLIGALLLVTALLVRNQPPSALDATEGSARGA